MEDIETGWMVIALGNGRNMYFMSKASESRQVRSHRSILSVYFILTKFMFSVNAPSGRVRMSRVGYANS